MIIINFIKIKKKYPGGSRNLWPDLLAISNFGPFVHQMASSEHPDSALVYDEVSKKQFKDFFVPPKTKKGRPKKKKKRTSRKEENQKDSTDQDQCQDDN